MKFIKRFMKIFKSLSAEACDQVFIQNTYRKAIIPLMYRLHFRSFVPFVGLLFPKPFGWHYIISSGSRCVLKILLHINGLYLKKNRSTWDIYRVLQRLSFRKLYSIDALWNVKFFNLLFNL